MASIPLPALDLKPPAQQPDLMSQYGNLMALQARQNQIQQQQALAPLQQQQAQNAAQSSGLQVQQQQQQLTDQKAITAAMQNWDGKDYNDLIPLVLKNGGSGQAVIGMKKNILDQQTQIATAAKDNGQAAEANVTATTKKNDLITGALSPLLDPKQVPDDQVAPNLLQTVQSLTQQGLLDPQHAQKAAQLAQSGDPTAIRNGIDLFRKTLMAQSQIMDEGLKNAQTASANSSTAKNQAESGYYAQNGGAPGVPAEQQQQNDWLAKHPGQGPSDFLAAKARMSPMAVVMGNQLGGGQNSQALDFAAQNYRQTGQMPPGLYRSPGTITAIIQRASQLDQQEGGNGLAANSAEYKANTHSLQNLQKNYDQVQAFEGTAQKNIDLLQQTAQKIPDLGSRFANVPVRMLNARMLGTENMAAFNTALNTAQTEAAKVLNSSNASGVLSDSARHELQQIVDGNMPYKSMVASLNTLKQDMANRTQAYQAQIGDIKQRIGGNTPTAGPAAAQQETRTYQGHTYVKGANGWQLQQ